MVFEFYEYKKSGKKKKKEIIKKREESRRYKGIINNHAHTHKKHYIAFWKEKRGLLEENDAI